MSSRASSRPRPQAALFSAGDTVYVMPYLSCGKCIACRAGKTNCCVHIQVLGVHRDGAFTEFLSVPQQFVHKAEGVSLDQAAMVEFLAIGAHAVRRAGMCDRASACWWSAPAPLAWQP